MMSGDEFREYLYQLTIWRHELAAFAGVSRRTVDRWCNSGAPLYAVRLADACGGIIRGGSFDGWQARHVLSGPTGESYSIEQIRAAHWLQQLAAEQAQETNRLRQKLNATLLEITTVKARLKRDSGTPAARQPQGLRIPDAYSQATNKRSTRVRNTCGRRPSLRDP